MLEFINTAPLKLWLIVCTQENAVGVFMQIHVISEKAETEWKRSLSSTVLMTLNCFCCFDRKPTPHSAPLYHGCCSTGSIVCVCACTVLESGSMSLLSLRPNVWVCLPDRKYMQATWPLAIGVNTRKDTGAGSLCVAWSISAPLTLALANVTSVTNEPAALMVTQLWFLRFSLLKAAISTPWKKQG